MNIKLVKDQKNRMKKTDRLIYNINNSNNNKKYNIYNNNFNINNNNNNNNNNNYYNNNNNNDNYRNKNSNNNKLKDLITKIVQIMKSDNRFKHKGVILIMKNN